MFTTLRSKSASYSTTYLRVYTRWNWKRTAFLFFRLFVFNIQMPDLTNEWLNPIDLRWDEAHLEHSVLLDKKMSLHQKFFDRYINCHAFSWNLKPAALSLCVLTFVLKIYRSRFICLLRNSDTRTQSARTVAIQRKRTDWSTQMKWLSHFGIPSIKCS